MATESEDRCPICLDSSEDPSFVMPCLHRFCHTCILQWADDKPECPLCKRRIMSILYSVWADDDYAEHVITPPTSSVIVCQGEGAPEDAAAQHLHHPGAPQWGAEEGMSRPPVGGLQPEEWARVFQALPSFLTTLLPWLQPTLSNILNGSRVEAATVEDRVMDILTNHGLHEELLVAMLQDSLLDYTVTFVQELIRVAVQGCRRETFRLFGLQEGLLAPIQSPAAALQHPVQTSSLAPHPLPSVGVPAPNLLSQIPSLPEEAESQEEPGQAVPSTSPSSRGRERSPAGPRQIRRRSASSSDDAPANKRPAARQ